MDGDTINKIESNARTLIREIDAFVDLGKPIDVAAIKELARRIFDLTEQGQRFCGKCRYWDFKASADHSYGCCRNGNAMSNISLWCQDAETITFFEDHMLPMIVVEEHGFGCMYWE